MSLQAQNGPTAVGVAHCGRCSQLAADQQHNILKAGMCSLWGPLATLDHLAGSARGTGALQAAAFAGMEDALQSQQCATGITRSTAQGAASGVLVRGGQPAHLLHRCRRQ